MIRVKVYTVLIIYLFCNIIFSASLFSAQELHVPTATIYAGRNNDLQLNAILQSGMSQVSQVFQECGRFKSRIVSDSSNIASSQSDIKVRLTIKRLGKNFTGEIIIVSNDKKYLFLNRYFTVKSRIAVNIPYLYALRITELHKKIPIHTNIIKQQGDGIIINAGQWHGLKKGSYKTNQGSVEVLETTRYTSRISSTKVKGNELRLDIFPSTDTIKNNLCSIIEDNTIGSYGIGYRRGRTADPEKRYIEGVCLINTGANCCLPIYGGFLATEYQGFKTIKADVPGLVFSGFLFVTQLTLTNAATGFKSNFFPWKQDSNKSDRMQNLHWFTWGAIPFTFAYSYLDQLSYQYKRSKLLPPFFKYRDETAAYFSLIVPGAGHVYKGNRLYGWTWYVTEMSLLGYTVFEWERASNSKRWILASALGILKALDMIHAYYSSTGYDFFEFEKGQQVAHVSAFPLIIPEENGGIKMGMAVTYRFN